MKKFFLFFLISIFLFDFVISAHPGKTDENGGHWDRSSGEYHFHSGEYKGKGSSGATKHSEYIPFTPPYDPPTENPYRNNNTDNNKLQLENIGIIKHIISAIKFIVIFLFLLFLACIIIMKIFHDIYESIIEPLSPKCYLNSLKRNLDELQLLKKRRNIYIEEIDTKYSQLKIPEQFEIGDDKLPKEKNCNNWGSLFTVYQSYSGNKLHVVQGCSNAFRELHIYNYYQYRNVISQLVCKKCGKNYSLPDLKWYENYLEYEKEIKKINEIKEKINSLQNYIEYNEKKWNSNFRKKLLYLKKKNIKKHTYLMQLYRLIKVIK